MGVLAPTSQVSTKESDATRLKTIKTITVLPECYTPRSRALTALKRIESINVAESMRRHGHRYYAIEIFYKSPRSRIPTLLSTAVKAGRPLARQPDVRIERRLSELGNFRHELYYFAHSGHGTKPCQFCSQIVDYLLHGSAKPRTLLGWLDSKEEAYATMAQFLTDILHITTTVKACGGHQCQGQDHIPSLLEDFLLLPTHS